MRSAGTDFDWDMPEGQARAPITGYRIQQEDADDLGMSDLDTQPAGDVNAYTYEYTQDEVRGKVYNYVIYADNKNGESIVSDQASVTFEFPPGNVANLREGLHRSHEQEILWDAPEEPGDFPITGYLIKCYVTGEDDHFKIFRI